VCLRLDRVVRQQGQTVSEARYAFGQSRGQLPRVHPGCVNKDVAARNEYRRPADRLERDGFKSNRHRALDLWWSMIFLENRYPLFRIML